MPQFVIAAAAVTAVVVSVKQVQAQKKTQKAAEKEAEKQRKSQEKMFQQELQAGEYFEQLNVKQMEMQTQQSSINTLANLIAETKSTAAQPQVFTLPAAKTYDPITRINQAIDELIRGK